MTLNFNSAGERVNTGGNEAPEIRPIVLQFQPVIVSGGKQVSTPLPLPVPGAAVKITIDPEKLKQ